MTGSLSLLERISQKIDQNEIHLPPTNQISVQLQEITKDPNFDLSKVVDLVVNDSVLTMEILRYANSSFYGGLTEIKTVREAAVRLGPQEVVRLAVLVTEKGLYKVKNPVLSSYLDPLWKHAKATALGARWLTSKIGYRDLENQAFIGGLLHDVGSLLLIRVMDEIFVEDPEAAHLNETLIEEIISSAHTTEGHKMAVMWGLPEQYCEIIRDHHKIENSEAGTLLNLVSLVDKANIQLGIGLDKDPSIVLSATEEAYCLAIPDLTLAQLAILLEDELQLI